MPSILVSAHNKERSEEGRRSRRHDVVYGNEANEKKILADPSFGPIWLATELLPCRRSREGNSIAVKQAHASAAVVMNTNSDTVTTSSGEEGAIWARVFSAFSSLSTN